MRSNEETIESSYLCTNNVVASEPPMPAYHVKNLHSQNMKISFES